MFLTKTQFFLKQCPLLCKKSHWFYIYLYIYYIYLCYYLKCVSVDLNLCSCQYLANKQYKTIKPRTCRKANLSTCRNSISSKRKLIYGDMVEYFYMNTQCLGIAWDINNNYWCSRAPLDTLSVLYWLPRRTECWLSIRLRQDPMASSSCEAGIDPSHATMAYLLRPSHERTRNPKTLCWHLLYTRTVHAK